MRSLPMLSPDLGRRRPLGVPREMGVFDRGHHRLVAEQPRDRRQALAERQRPGRITVAAVVKPQAVQPGARPQLVPERVEALKTAALLLARDHPRVVLRARQPRQHPLHRRRQRHPARTRLAVPEPQLARPAVDVVPAQHEDLVATAPGQQQQPDRRHRRRHERAFGFDLEQHAAEPGVFVLGQEALAAFLPVALDRPARVGPRRGHAPGDRKLEHLREHAHRLVRPGGRRAQPVMQRGDMRAVDLAPAGARRVRAGCAAGACPHRSPPSRACSSFRHAPS